MARQYKTRAYTTRHYEQFADLLAYNRPPFLGPNTGNMLDQWEIMVGAVADMFQSDSRKNEDAVYRFNKGRFVEACNTRPSGVDI